jgi:hypothetical protein
MLPTSLHGRDAVVVAQRIATEQQQLIRSGKIE